MRTARENFNNGWRCCAGNLPQAEDNGYDDSFFQPVDLPHDWSIRQNFDSKLTHGNEHAYLPNGIVWYRKKFDFCKQAGETVILEFDGIYRSPDIFVNGRHLARRFNGYVGFEVDITAALIDGENLIAVRVDNSVEKSSRWYTGTGINRSVHLHRLNKTHFLRNGVRVSAASCGSIELEAKSTRPGKVKFRLFDPSGKEIAGPEAPAGSVASGKVDSPELWSPDTPVLYRCVAELYDDSGRLTDEWEERFGFRSVEFSPEQGFLLNGEKLMLRGVNLHEDLCGIGTAVYKDGIRRRYERLKSWGVNAIRLAHHPYAPEWYELADEMGFLIFAEAFDKWDGQYNGFQVDFEVTWRRDLTEFIESKRNHPSIFIWSVGNEVVTQQLSGKHQYGISQYNRMRDLVRGLDPSRKVTCALYPARKSGVIWKDPTYQEADIAEMAFAMDVVSANYMGQFFAADHRRYPEMVFLVSEETTSNGAARWRVFDHKIGCGSFFWGGYDYLGEAQWPHKNWFRGLMDRAGFRKPVSYQLEALWSENPVAYIAVSPDRELDSVEWNAVQLDWENLVSHWNWTEGESCRLVLYSNCVHNKLLLNGRTVLEHSLKYEDDCRIKCEIPYEPGELKLVGLGPDGAVLAEYVLRTSGPMTGLKINLLPGTPAAGGLAHAELQAFDANGIPCPSGKTVHLEVDGAGTLAGVVNGDTLSDNSFAGDAVPLFQGGALAVIRLDVPGEFRVRAFTEDVKAEVSMTIL